MEFIIFLIGRERIGNSDMRGGAACFSGVQRWCGSAWAHYNLGDCRYTCLCLWLCSCTGNGWGSGGKGDVIVYYGSENSTRIRSSFVCTCFQGDPCQNLKWTHHTHAVPWATFTHNFDTWRVALHGNLLCFAVTGSSVPGNRPVGMGGEGAYKHRHAHTIGEHRCSSIA